MGAMVASSSQQGLRSRFRYPELDGLRGIAILMVLAEHYEFRGLVKEAVTGTVLAEYLAPVSLALSLGWTGVDLFFVLSGFLLGGILLDNRQAPNLFKVFYTRRACRIWPLYYLIVVFLLVIPQPWNLGINPAFGWAPSQEPLPAWTYLTLTQNITMGLKESAGSVWLTPTWSLAVEEQFYLVLPFLVRFVRKERLLYLIFGLIFLTALSRWAVLAYYPHGDFAFWFLPCRAESLFWGVLGAWVVRDNRCMNVLNTHRKILYGVLVMLAVSTYLVAAVGYLKYTWLPVVAFPPTFGYTVLSLLYTCVVLIAVTERRGLLTSVARNNLLGKIGVISFGLYLLHLPVAGLFWFLLGGESSEGLTRYLITLGAWLLPFALATVSWAFFERPIVQWGRSFRYESVKDERAENEVSAG
jgi:peptidoglycan/LPS O-acetylase OafA/YrhL